MRTLTLCLPRISTSSSSSSYIRTYTYSHSTYSLMSKINDGKVYEREKKTHKRLYSNLREEIEGKCSVLFCFSVSKGFFVISRGKGNDCWTAKTRVEASKKIVLCYEKERVVGWRKSKCGKKIQTKKNKAWVWLYTAREMEDEKEWEKKREGKNIYERRRRREKKLQKKG